MITNFMKVKIENKLSEILNKSKVKCGSIVSNSGVLVYVDGKITNIETLAFKRANGSESVTSIDVVDEDNNILFSHNLSQAKVLSDTDHIIIEQYALSVDITFDNLITVNEDC